MLWPILREDAEIAMESLALAADGGGAPSQASNRGK